MPPPARQPYLPSSLLLALDVSRSSEMVPLSLLYGASCPVPLRSKFSAFAWAAPGAPPTYVDLSPAEQRVLELLLTGLSNKEIANEISRSPATVKNQIASILGKYRVPSRARLMALLR